MENTKLISHFESVENVGLEIQRKRSDAVAFDQKRQSSREAVKALSKINDKTIWCCVGETFLKLPKSNCEQKLKSDIRKIDNEMKSNNEEVKKLVKVLDDLENSHTLKGFDLNAVNLQE